MELNVYLELNDLTPADVARDTLIPIDSIYRWLRKGNKPIPTYIKIIEKFTKGNVTKKDWK